jgi:PPE-repeat protein
VIDFGVLPPEINSGRMYVGDGAASLLSAAAGWEAIAAGLIAAAGGMGAVTAGLVGTSWSGPSSAMMGMSAAQFIGWVAQTAARAEMSAAAALAAADAHATAFAATIPPPEVERNQFTTATLIATNFMGVNSAAIAASQAQYEEYWAQDASAMYTYAAANMTVATSLNAPPFLPAMLSTDPAGLGAQAAAVGEAAGQDAGQAATTVGGATSNLGGMSSAMGSVGSLASAPAQAAGAIPQAFGQMASPLGSIMSAMTGGMGGQGFTSPLGAGVLPMMGGFGGGAAGVGSFGGMSYNTGMGPLTASMGRGASVGRLSVPASWAGSSEYVSPVRPLANSGAAARTMISEQAETFGSGNMARPPVGMLPMAGMGSGGTTSTHYGTPIKVTKRKVF